MDLGYSNLNIILLSMFLDYTNVKSKMEQVGLISISLFSWHALPMTYAKKIRISIDLGLGSEILALFKSPTYERIFI